MPTKPTLLRDTILDPGLSPYLISSEAQMAKSISEEISSKIEGTHENQVVYCSLAPISMLYFHVRLALLMRHLQNLRVRVFAVNLDNVAMAHVARSYHRYYPTEGKRRFLLLLEALGVDISSPKFEFTDWRVLHNRTMTDESYFQYCHSVDTTALAKMMESIPETAPFRRLVDVATYAEDVFLASRLVPPKPGHCDFIAGSIDRFPVYDYCLRALEREIGPPRPTLLPFASMPLIQGDISDPYPAVEDSQRNGLVESKVRAANLAKRELILLIKTLLEAYCEETGQTLQALAKFHRSAPDSLSQSALLETAAKGMEELFGILWQRMRGSLPSDIKEVHAPAELKEVFAAVGGSVYKFRILEMIFKNPGGLTAHQIRNCVSEADASTAYRVLQALERAGLVICNRREHPAKYYPSARKVTITIQSGSQGA